MRMPELVAKLLDGQLSAKKLEPHTRGSGFQIASDVVHDAKHGQELDHAQAGHALLVLDNVHFGTVGRTEYPIDVVQPRALVEAVQERYRLGSERMAIMPTCYVIARRPCASVSDVVHRLVHLRTHEECAVDVHWNNAWICHERHVLVSDWRHIIHEFNFFLVHAEGIALFFRAVDKSVFFL